MTKRQVQRTGQGIHHQQKPLTAPLDAETLIVWGIRRFDLGVARALMGRWKTMHSFPKNSSHLWLKNCSQLQCTSFNLCNITWACDCNRLVVVQTVCQQGTEAEKSKKKQQPEELSSSGVTSL